LRDQGVFLIDAVQEPLDGAHLEIDIEHLARRIKRLRPARVIIVKTGVFDQAYESLVDLGIPVINERIPFPGSGQQVRFRQAFSRALRGQASGRAS
jgi:hypothetical protein